MLNESSLAKNERDIANIKWEELEKQAKLKNPYLKQVTIPYDCKHIVG